jgi:hypothetical protein
MMKNRQQPTNRNSNYLKGKGSTLRATIPTPPSVIPAINWDNKAKKSKNRKLCIFLDDKFYMLLQRA